MMKRRWFWGRNPARQTAYRDKVAMQIKGAGVSSALSPDEILIVNEFARIFWEKGRETFFCNRFMGVPTLQHPFDLWITQEIMCEVAPELVVECGSFSGGSALLWAMLLEHINPRAKVIAIDIEDRMQQARKRKLFRRKVEFIHGSSVDPEVIARVAKRVKGRRTLVILDSDHTEKHVAAELRGYAPLVSPGSYMICQDGFVNGHPLEPDWGPGPLEAIQAFLAEHDEFEIDSSRERMLFTFNPSGFLRRK